MVRRASPLLCIAGLAGALWLAIPFGLLGYDTWYSVLWGGEVAAGQGPDYGAAQPPTPHPLGVLWGALVSPLGVAGAVDATVALGYVSLAAVAYAVYRLGSLWFDRAVGMLAAAIVLTRTPFLLYGLRAYVDLPYLALVLAALVLESKQPRRGAPVLALLALAGLIRPEAWLFSAAYIAHLTFALERGGGGLAVRRRGDRSNREVAGLAGLAVSAPLLWAGYDLIASGDPTYSFTQTHERVTSLERHTGFLDLIRFGPHELGVALQWPVAIGAAAGLALGLIVLRSKTLPGAIATALAGAAFAILASAGFSIIDRYTLLVASLLCVFCAGALLGWRLVAPGDGWRRRWLAAAALVLLLFLAQAPQQIGFLSDARDGLAARDRLDDDLRLAVHSAAIDPACRPVSVATDRSVPRLAAWLDVPPSEVLVLTEGAEPAAGLYFSPNGSEAQLHFGRAPAPPGFEPRYRNDSWIVYAQCR